MMILKVLYNLPVSPNQPWNRPMTSTLEFWKIK